VARKITITGGRDATAAVIPGDICLAVGLPKRPAPLGWSWRPLSSIARLESGHTPSRKHPEYWGGDIPWIGIRDATGNHGRVIYETSEYTNALGIANSSARLLAKDTVCLSRTASVGYVVMMGRPMATSQDFVNWVCSDELNPHFLKYALLSETRALRMFAVGSVHPTIYFPEVKAFHLCTPSRSEQDRIVDVLCALDDKIDLNRQMNETLEAMARAIFEDWFVDFGPTRAKMRGQAPYLAPEIWALFPDKLDNDGKPEGWRQAVLEEILGELETGGRPKGGVSGYTFGVPSVGAESIVGLGIFDYSKTKYVPKEFFEAMTKGHVKSRDVLLYKDGGRPGQFEPHVTLFGDGFPFDIFAINEHVYRLRAKPDLGQAFLYFLLSSAPVMEEMRIKGTGVAVPGLNSTQVKSLTTMVPQSELSRAFDMIVDSFISKLLANCREARSLANMRDLLLPKLISGELHLKDAEKALEAAL
jgi:type I restriction enzyme S subunit